MKYNYKSILNKVRELFTEFLSDKKIIIVTKGRMVNITLSSRLQFILLSCVIISFSWLGYSSIKYFVFNNMLDSKNRELWSQNITNETIKYQVDDLYKSLMYMNRYMENFKGDENISESDISDGSIGRENRSSLQFYPERVSQIKTEVSERIQILESLIGYVGLDLEEIASNNSDLRKNLDAYQRIASSEEEVGFIQASASKDFNYLMSGDFESKLKYLMSLEKFVWSLPIAKPLEKYRQSSGFGRRAPPVEGGGSMHTGVDLINKYLANVLTSAPGRVKFAGRNGAYGMFVEIDHGYGVKTRYGHLAKVMVKKGDMVKRGDIIGLQGNSGRSTGSHLHYEVVFNSKPIDPENFLKVAEHVYQN